MCRPNVRLPESLGGSHPEPSCAQDDSPRLANQGHRSEGPSPSHAHAAVALRIGSVDNADMSIEEWWPKLRRQSRDYLINNNGDVVPPDLVVKIAQAGGVITSDAWWVGQSGPSGFYLSDEAVDWIEEVANGETPAPRPDDLSPTA